MSCPGSAAFMHYALLRIRFISTATHRENNETNLEKGLRGCPTRLLKFKKRRKLITFHEPKSGSNTERGRKVTE